MLISIPQCIILEIPDTLSQWSHIWFWLSIFENSSEKLHCGNAVNMPYRGYFWWCCVYWSFLCVCAKAIYSLFCVMKLKRALHCRCACMTEKKFKWEKDIPIDKNCYCVVWIVLRDDAIYVLVTLWQKKQFSICWSLLHLASQMWFVKTPPLSVLTWQSAVRMIWHTCRRLIMNVMKAIIFLTAPLYIRVTATKQSSGRYPTTKPAVVSLSSFLWLCTT